MIELSFKKILEVIEGNLVYGDINCIIRYVSTGRMMKNNTLFLDKYKDKPVDLNPFKAYKDIIIVTEEPEKFISPGSLVTLVKVNDIGVAYWRFVEYYRSLLTIPIIGVTGTCGKTTTKEMIKHILSFNYNVCSTIKSNNQGSRDIYYLTSMDKKTEVGIFEMGVSHPNDLVDSCRVFKPQTRILLNIGVYHLEGCKTPENYFNAKAKIVEGLDELSGTLILNADDNNIMRIDVSKINNIIYFGLSKKADFRADDIEYTREGMKFKLKKQAKEYKSFIPAFGVHNIYNALAAVAAVSNIGVPIYEALENLKTFRPVEEHLEILSGVSECTLIDDTWSSAPLSVISALETAKSIAGGRKTIALIGVSPLLGEGKYAEEEYSTIGRKVVETGVKTLVVVGEQAKTVGNTALALGMKENDVHFSDNTDEIYKIIASEVNKDTVVLLKITHRQMVEPAFVELKRKLIGKKQ